MHLSSLFNQIESKTILVMGDLLFDQYTIGTAKRISPEAPVAIVHVKSSEHRPGGAGNVALNLISYGASVRIAGRVGEDRSGNLLKEDLLHEGIECSGVLSEASFYTPEKNRIIADKQQVVRVDHEEVMSLTSQIEQKIIEELPELLQGVDAVVLSDYAKGFLTRKLLQAVFKLTNERNIPTIVDPKGGDFSKYQGATVIKPNQKEAFEAAGLGLEVSIDQVAEKLLSEFKGAALFITRSEEGIALFESGSLRQEFSAVIQEVNDVTGAGDTVSATLAWAIANGLNFSNAAKLSNLAAGLSLQHLGCARITLRELAHHALQLDSVNKVFEEDHIEALLKVLEGEQFTLVGIHEKEGITPDLFTELEAQKGKLLIYVRDQNPSDAFIRFLASIQSILFIIVKRESLSKLAETLHPEAVYVVEGGRLVLRESFDHLLV